MAAQRCSLCSINYPIALSRCRVCEEPTSYVGSSDPDPDWERIVAVRLEMPVSTEADRVEMWRLERTLALGYSVELAESIAVSDADLNLLDRLIGSGCPLELAARII